MRRIQCMLLVAQRQSSPRLSLDEEGSGGMPPPGKPAKDCLCGATAVVFRLSLKEEVLFAWLYPSPGVPGCEL